MDDNKRTRCEIYTRVMGYHRPVKNFNAGKQQEHADRVHFLEKSHDKREPARERSQRLL